MIVIFRPKDFTDAGMQAYKNTGKFHPNHLKYNAAHYFKKTSEAYFTDDKDVRFIEDMQQVK